MDGEIEEVENPDNSGGPNWFRFVMFKATEKLSHKKRVQTDKAKHGAHDLAFTLDDVHMDLARKKDLQNIAVCKQLSSGSLGTSAMTNSARASGAGSPAKPVQASGKPGPPLAIENAKERDRLLCKVEEALKSSYGLALNLSKVIAQLPATVLGSKHKGSQEEMYIVVSEQESRLEHIAINGALPGQSTTIGVHELKNVLEPCQVHFDDLRKALDMAAPLLKKVEEQENSG